MARRERRYLPATLDAVSVLGAQIAAARRELGWSAAELGRRVGVSAPVISRIENGHPTGPVPTPHAQIGPTVSRQRGLFA